MAGRGTDIVLGGNVENQIPVIDADETTSRPKTSWPARAKLHDEWQGLHDAVIAEGGLHIIATERHESRRIDNQLRGRSGRQGDPGSSRFYLSLDDSLMRIFAGDRVRAIMERLKMPDGEAIEAGIVTRSIEGAQPRSVEARNFDVRKQLLEYDDVANDQRKVIYQQRNDILEAPSLAAQIQSLRRSTMEDVVRTYVPAESVEEQWDLKGLEKVLAEEWKVDVMLAAHVDKSDDVSDEDIVEKVQQARRRAVRQQGRARRHGAVHAVHADDPAAVDRPGTGASTWPRSITCARASTCAATRRRTRSRNTSARRSNYSRRCSTSSRWTLTRVLMSVRIQSEEESLREAGAGDRGARRAHRQRHLHPPQRRRQCLAGARQRIGSGRGGDGRGGGGDGVVTRRDGRGAEGRAQRSVSLRQREEIQALPRAAGLGTVATAADLVRSARDQLASRESRRSIAVLNSNEMLALKRSATALAFR